MIVSNNDIIKVFLRKAALNKQKQHSIKHLLELIDTYDEARRDQCKLERTTKGFRKTDFHTIAGLNYKEELFDYAVKIKADNPSLPNVPEYTGQPDYDVSKLRQWAINAQIILSEKRAETEQDTTPAKRRGIWNRVRGFFRELYGLTIERITKAFLDKYG